MTHRAVGFYAGVPWGGVVVLEDADQEVTDTAILQKPVDYALAGDQEDKRRLGGPGVMTKSMLNKIFRE